MIWLNEKPYELKEEDKGKTILEICRKNGVEIPTLCYHELLEPFTSCYLCIVKIEGRGNRFFPSCSMKIEDGMRIITDDDEIRATRKTNLELLLSNHEADCISPCTMACPAEIDIQAQVALIKNKRYIDAVKITRDAVPFPSVLGRVCPSPCETMCRRQEIDDPLAICSLKRYLGDMEIDPAIYLPNAADKTGRKICIVGAGPAGLSAAYYLALKGHEVFIYEQMEKAGGMLRYGIPYYRLSEKVLDKEIDEILQYDMKITYRKKLGRDIFLHRLVEEFDAVLLAMGCWAPTAPRIKGADLTLDGIQFLREIAQSEEISIGSVVAVVGGGNTAIDSARTALRLDSRVKVLYRRTKAEMPANAHEIHEAEEEGVQFHFLISPVSVERKAGRLKVICQKMELGESDASGRRRPVPIQGQFEEYIIDTLILAIGQRTDPGIIKHLKGIIPLTKWGTIDVNMNGYTGKGNIFAAGDISMGPGLVVEAIATGRHSAEAIDQFVRGKSLTDVKGIKSKRSKTTENYLVAFNGISNITRYRQKFKSPEIRKTNFMEYASGMSESEVLAEAGRCMTCGCFKVDSCNIRIYADELHVDQDRFKGETIDYPVDMSHPYIGMDLSRCISCGLCIRFCSELRGVGVFAFTNRGFKTQVAPEFFKPLNETNCIACGDCIAVCPTGALFGRTPNSTPLPHYSEVTPSTCQYCGLNCQMQLQHLYSNISWINGEPRAHNNIHLCVYGRFFYDHLFQIDPYAINNDPFQKVSEIADRLIEAQDLQIFASPSLTTEELTLIKRIADLLGSSVTSFAGLRSKMTDPSLEFSNESFQAIPFRAAKFEDINLANLIILVGFDSTRHSAVMDPLLRQAMKRGATILALGESNYTTPKTIHIEGDSMHEVCSAVCKFLDDEGKIGSYAKVLPDWAEFRKQFIERSKDFKLPQEAKDILREHQKQFVLIVGDFLYSECTQRLSILFGLENPVKTFTLRPHANARVFGKLFDKPILKAPKSALIIGENPAYYEPLQSFLKKFKQLIVFDFIDTETTEIASLVYKIMPPYFNDGSLYSIKCGLSTCRSINQETGKFNQKFIIELLKEIALKSGKDEMAVPPPKLTPNILPSDVSLKVKDTSYPYYEFDTLKLYHKRIYDGLRGKK